MHLPQEVVRALPFPVAINLHSALHRLLQILIRLRSPRIRHSLKDDNKTAFLRGMECFLQTSDLHEIRLRLLLELLPYLNLPVVAFIPGRFRPVGRHRLIRDYQCGQRLEVGLPAAVICVLFQYAHHTLLFKNPIQIYN